VDYTLGSDITINTDIENCVDDPNKVIVNGESGIKANCDSEAKSVIEGDQSMDMDGNQSKDEDISIGSPDAVVMDTESSRSDKCPTKEQSPIRGNPEDGTER
jgi:flagellar hook assembly protein FlgD